MKLTHNDRKTYIRTFDIDPTEFDYVTYIDGHTVIVFSDGSIERIPCAPEAHDEYIDRVQQAVESGIGQGKVAPTPRKHTFHNLDKLDSRLQEAVIPPVDRQIKV